MRVGLALLALALAGCVTEWRPAGPAPERALGGELEVTAPDGWLRMAYDDEQLVFTRDGPRIQTLSFAVGRRSPTFRFLERDADPSLLPSELAELTIAEAKLLAGSKGVEVIELGPAVVAGRDGFRVRLRYADGRGLRRDDLGFGAVSAGSFLFASYTAPTLHYFERDLAAVERAVASFRHHR